MPEFWQALPSLPDRAAALLRRFGEFVDEAPVRAALDALAEGLVAEPRPAVDPAARLGTAVQLSPFEYDLLLLAGLPEEHEAVTRLARQWHVLGEAVMTLGAAAAVLGLGHAGRGHLRRALETGPLHRHGLVTGPEAVPLPERGLRLPTGLWSVLRGIDHWPGDLHPLASPGARGVTLPLGAERLADALGSGPRVVLVTGEGRAEEDLAAAAVGALAAAGRSAVAVPGGEVDPERAPAWTAHLLARGAVPVLVGRPTGPPLPAHPGTVVVAVAGTVAGLPLDERPVLAVELSRPRLGETVKMWHGLLPELNGAGATLAGLLRVGELAARRAVTDSRAEAAQQDSPRPVTVGDVLAGARRRVDVRLPHAVRLVRPKGGLHSLVLSDEQNRLLGSVVARLRGQAQVLDDWGFARSARNHGGVRLLLCGPPGTGKTLAAEAVAADLGLDLLVVDLAALVSKWLGETEKNIAEVFDAAEHCQAVLFFDEADAVFARRTDASDAHGRWANLETAYLLGRLDLADGLVVLATNLRRAIDEAFLRRLDVVVDLEEPDRPARERLWRQHLPPDAPRAPDVDLSVLAARYEITGGLIRNAALTAAFTAAATGRPIDQDGLVAAVHDEYRKAGRSFPGSPRPAAVRSAGRS